MRSQEKYFLFNYNSFFFFPHKNRWIFEILDLSKQWTWVQIFENRGALMGCSNAHPHCQIWASSFLPNEARIKDKYLAEYYNRNKKPLLIDYMEKEILKRVNKSTTHIQ